MAARPGPPTGGRTYLENNLDFLEEEVLGKKVSVFLAGDLHHYRRHANAEGRQKIIAGGGGAFLHPTHVPRKEEPLPRASRARKSFPNAQESRRLCWRNLGLPVAATPLRRAHGAALHAAGVGALGEPGEARCRRRWGSCAHGLSSPGLVIVAVFAMLGLIGFADQRFGRWRWLAGMLHGAGAPGRGIPDRLGRGTPDGLDELAVGSLQRDVLSAVLIFAGGFLAGPTIMGLYLLLSLNAFGAHANEAFSSLAIPDWKNFVRLHIDKQGHLRLYPIGFRRVARSWKPGESARIPRGWRTRRTAEPRLPRSSSRPSPSEPPPHTGAGGIRYSSSVQALLQSGALWAII